MAEVIVRTFPLKLSLPIVVGMKVGEGAEQGRNHVIKRPSLLAHGWFCGVDAMVGYSGFTILRRRRHA